MPTTRQGLRKTWYEHIPIEGYYNLSLSANLRSVLQIWYCKLLSWKR